jgi:hypothetical protein
MEMTEMVVWRTRGVTAVHLQAPLGWLMMTGATWNNRSCQTFLGLDHKDTTFFPTMLVGIGSPLWVPRYLRHCGYVTALWLLLPLARKERQKLCLPLSSPSQRLAHTIVTFIYCNYFHRGNLLR